MTADVVRHPDRARFLSPRLAALNSGFDRAVPRRPLVIAGHRAERDESDIVKLYLRGIGQYALLTKLEETSWPR